MRKKELAKLGNGDQDRRKKSLVLKLATRLRPIHFVNPRNAFSRPAPVCKKLVHVPGDKSVLVFLA
jgi:hypothetical protein